MSFLYENAAVMYIALALSAVTWIFGGTRGELLVPVVPWLVVFMLEVMLCFPQRRTGESMNGARHRVWKAMWRDPLVWTALGLTALLAVPFVNNGLCPVCDYDKIMLGLDPSPPVKFLPFCVERMHHLNVFLWFAFALSAGVAVKHALRRRGKRLLVELIVWNGAALAVLGFVQSATGAMGPFWCALPDGQRVDFFSSFGYPNMAGDYFTTLFGLAIALWRDVCEKDYRENLAKSSSERAKDADRLGRFWRRNYFLLPAAVFFFAALNTLSRAAIILVTVTAVVYFAHTLVVILSRMRKSRRVFIGVWSLVVFGLLVFFAAIFMPEKIQREVNTLDDTTMLDRVTGKAHYHVDVATALWKDHKLFGCGGWGYAHLCVPKMQELEIDTKGLQTVGGAYVHNDHLQFLAEHGLVGYGCLVAIVVLLVWPVVRQWRDMVRDLRFKKAKELPPRPIAIFALPAPVFFILMTVLATFIHAFGDCPLRSCAVLDLFFISLAALPGFMPKPVAREYHHHHH